MRFPAVFLLKLLPLARHGGGTSFVSPGYQPSKGRGRYDPDSQWPLGSTQVVAYSVPWSNYRLEFWQQQLPAGGAKLSSQFKYNQSPGQDLPQSFRWTVQTYEFQLSDSPIFFFWLFNNDNSTQKQSSAYFNITIDGTTSAVPTSSSEPTPPAAVSKLSSAFTASTVTSTTLSNAYTPSMTTPNTLTPTLTGAPHDSDGLSTGAAVGIGAGTSLGILVFGILGFIGLKRWKPRAGQQQNSILSDPKPMVYSTGPPEVILSTSQYTQDPLEANSHYNPPPLQVR
ncbi:hypothetical protein F4777DRAFT_493890 [Nemania sp. FL0916]|nr:hypothetical protein F4777DRAFT_493890 [Nemania sp. FL0916]